MREGIENAYQQLLSENSGWKADIGGLLLKQTSPSEADGIEIPFSETEIYAALMGMNGDKAPGPDGFTVAFWQSSWEIVKEDILGLFKEFHEQNSFIKSLNHTFLVLIPKKGGVEDLVLVNGVPAGFFSSTKGLRQGDPLSPSLFVMGMEVLSVLITRAVEGGFIHGCRIWRGREQAVNITHLLFADDTIVFCEAKKEALLHLGWILFGLKQPQV
ncbi:putative mitochondrial protein [Vitis vinifera]|uniref:Putative mitochondrial protein n=1 Tax=Vitis vinifera TaxID=29760 RepID=A0A438KQQ6_VITVI|nr:putative mitochondrial protein [Vitis vinifera]